MKKPVIWLALGCVIPIFAIVAWMMLDNACSSLGEAKIISECWRGWTSAWSGWFGGVMALAGAYLAFVTIQKQIEQQHLHQRQKELLSQRKELMDEKNVLVSIARALKSAQDINEQIQKPFHESEVEKFQNMISRIPIASLRSILGATTLDPTFRSSVSLSMELLEDIASADSTADELAYTFGVACTAIGKHHDHSEDRLCRVTSEIALLDTEIATCSHELDSLRK